MEFKFKSTCGWFPAEHLDEFTLLPAAVCVFLWMVNLVKIREKEQASLIKNGVISTGEKTDSLPHQLISGKPNTHVYPYVRFTFYMDAVVVYGAQ